MSDNSRNMITLSAITVCSVLVLSCSAILYTRSNNVVSKSSMALYEKEESSEVVSSDSSTLSNVLDHQNHESYGNIVESISSNRIVKKFVITGGPCSG